MSDQVIHFDVDPEGRVVIAPAGFAGPACREATKAYEDALGPVDSDEETAEMHEVVAEPARERRKA